MANKTERFTTVWDAAGVKRRVRLIDAREIVEGGGSWDEAHPVTFHAVEEEVAVEDVNEKPKAAKARK